MVKAIKVKGIQRDFYLISYCFMIKDAWYVTVIHIFLVNLASYFFFKLEKHTQISFYLIPLLVTYVQLSNSFIQLNVTVAQVFV